MKTEGSDYGPGDIVILRGLRAHHKGGAIGPRVGQIARVLPRGRLLVRLHLGAAFNRSTHFCRRGRVCELANVVRHATERERTLGSAILVETLRPAVAA